MKAFQGSSAAKPDAVRRCVVVGLAPPDGVAWGQHAARNQAVVVPVASIDAGFERSSAPTVVVTRPRNFLPRLISRTDPLFGDTGLLLVGGEHDDLDPWRYVASGGAVPIGSPIEAIDAALAFAFDVAHRRLAERQRVEDYHRRLNNLSADEREVFEAVCAGRLNKQIANEVRVSVRTIEQRRRRMFDKMGVESAVPLAALRAAVQTLEEQWRTAIPAPSEPVLSTRVTPALVAWNPASAVAAGA